MATVVSPDTGAPAMRGSGRVGFLDRHARSVFLVPAMLYLLVMSVYPFVYSVYLSLTDRNLARSGTGSFVGLDNYRTLLSDSLFQTGLINTAVVTVGSIAIELVIGFAIARAFFVISHRRGISTLRTIFIVPMMVTPVVAGLLWTFILNPTLGIANYLLGTMGLPAYSGFASSGTALLSVIMVNAWQWIPFLMLLSYAGLSAVPQDMREAAAIDGAGLWSTIRHIELPSVRTLLLIGVMFRVIDNFRLFDVVFATTRGGPGDATEIISMFAYREMFQFFNVGFGSAVSVVILVLGLLLANVLFSVLRKADS